LHFWPATLSSDRTGKSLQHNWQSPHWRIRFPPLAHMAPT
jgi:hypothetical protein